MMIDDVDAGPTDLLPAVVIELALGKRISIFAFALPALVASASKASR